MYTVCDVTLCIIYPFCLSNF
uniref:Uncharacterized protein n=1 Tax=Anguilla anguilla TaxID=7936 RepID=A0A0E9R0B9_ANGAN